MGLGQVLSQLERYESAEKTFRKGAALHPEEPDFLYYIGLVCEMSGRPADALASYQQFVQKAPNHELAPAVRRMIEKLKQ
jgi:tetratricopeptide (TPR) repeat protein